MRIMIIGGTSGIGLALARHYLEQGAQVAICGRDPDKVNGLDIARHRQLQLICCDIADGGGVARVISMFGAEGLDLLIVTAGQYADAASLALAPRSALSLLNVNVGGLHHAFAAASGIMLAQGKGHLVAVASVAGLLDDYPGASLYSASKRAAIAICDAYRKALAPLSIAVTAIVPGYIDTAALRALNRGDASHKPFLLPEHEAVRHISAAIARRDARCIFPWQIHLLVRLFNCLPARLRRLRKK
ncbi:MAG: SDR family NAD(P)-dependent oxidoreductase [Pseudomonadota bacterium]